MNLEFEEYIAEKIYSVPIVRLTGMIKLLLFVYLWYHIGEAFGFIGEFGGTICLNHQIRN